MAPGRKQLRRIQLGKEVTPGTAVPATTRLRMNGVLKDLRTVEEIEEDVGIFGGLDRTAIPKLFGSIDIPDQVCSFQQIQYFLAMGLGGPTTGAADGSGTDLIYVTNIPTTSAPTLKHYTVQGGDDSEQEVMEYCYCAKIHLAGKPGETLKLGATINGRQVSRLAGGFTNATLPDQMDDVLVSLGKVYLDAIGGTYGTTPVANVILGLDVTYEFMIVPKYTPEGNLYFSYPVYTGHKITGKLTFEHDTLVQGNTGQKAIWRAQTPQLLRLDFTGKAVGTPGTLYSNDKLMLDLPIKYKVAGGLEDQEGNDIVTMEFTSKYNATAANAGKFTVVTELSALP